MKKIKIKRETPFFGNVKTLYFDLKSREKDLDTNHETYQGIKGNVALELLIVDGEVYCIDGSDWSKDDDAFTIYNTKEEPIWIEG